jgi:type IV pilus assembly protein PilC
MLFNYKTINKQGQEQLGSIDAPTMDQAVASLQKRELIVVSIDPAGRQSKSVFKLRFFDHIKTSDIVILSRQIATLFEAKVSVLSTFRLLATESDNPLIKEKLGEMTEDIKGGVSISDAMIKHPDVFSNFYVSMVKSGEESGKLSETFNYLADYLDRTYELMSKTKNALIYPAFVIVSFIGVMILMMVVVIPKLGVILEESGQQLPIYTRVIINISNFFANYWYILLLFTGAVTFFLIRYLPTQAGKASYSRFQLSVPYIGDLYKKLYLSRIADNLDTMITSGVSMVRALEITADVVDNAVYSEIMMKSSVAIKGGAAVSQVFAQYPEIPGIMVQMIKVGEETGRVGYVLKTLAAFYRREVNNAVDTLVGLIEPVMIVFLGVGVGILLTSVLLPIYNVASSL